jgi:hypothetical protein
MIQQEVQNRILPAIFAMAIVVATLWIFLGLLRP